MKKCGIFIFSFIIAILFSCGGNNNKIQSENSTEKDICISRFELHKKYKLSEMAENSPTLTLDISLPLVKTGNTTADENINRTISYTLFESNEASVEKACSEFAETRQKEYMEFLPDYLNGKEGEMPMIWLNNSYNISGEAEIGYNDYINYIILWDEFTGGAHPNSYYTVLNFNPATGEEVVLQDILKENYEEPLIALLVSTLAADLNVDNYEDIKSNGYLYPNADMYISNNYILEKEQIVFIYNKYDIAPYAMGDIIINISYEKLKDLLK